MSNPIAINDRPYLSGRAVFPEGRWRPILTLGGEWRPTLTLVLWPGDAVAWGCCGLGPRIAWPWRVIVPGWHSYRAAELWC